MDEVFEGRRVRKATGLLIARDETIFVERCQYGRTDGDRFTSWSMAKTVTAMLIGIAIAEGTSLRHLLQMSSGVRFSEESSGTKFSYASVETQVLGPALRSVIGRPVNAVLRDYARLGLLLAHDGNWRGRQLVPAAWIKDARKQSVDPQVPEETALWRGVVRALGG